MKKANNVLRRSSVKLKSLSSGNADLQLIISQIKDVKSSFRSFMDSQEVLAEDLYAWSQKLDNDAIQNSFSYMLQISGLWTEAQKAFYETLKQYKEEFELILDGDKHVSQAKKIADSKEEVEVKVKRELQKASKRGPLQELEVLRAKVNEAEKAKEIARVGFSEKLLENEAVRMIRVKESSMRLGSAYHEMAAKCSSLFHAHHLMSQEIPDVHGKEIHNVRFKVNACKDHLKNAQEQIISYRKDSIRRPFSIGPVRRLSSTSTRVDVLARTYPPTAPTPSLCSSMSSVAIANPPNVYPNLDNMPLNNFDTDRSNEKSNLQKMRECSLPHGEPNDESDPTNNGSSQGTPPPYNPYYD